jgi:hypothetical protein
MVIDMKVIKITEFNLIKNLINVIFPNFEILIIFGWFLKIKDHLNPVRFKT